MSLWTVFKLFAAIGVLTVMSFTGMLTYHILVRPLGGIFERIIPNPGEIVGRETDVNFATIADAVEIPAIDPGAKAFKKAHDLLALGKLDEAREKLSTIINVYPSSSKAPMARRIVGDMNLDEILSTSHMQGKLEYVVKPGNSFLGIAAEHHTTLDLIMHLNNMMELGNLQPGDELVVMPLEYRLLIDSKRKTLSIWDGGRFVSEYPIIHLGIPGGLPAGKSKIGSKTAEAEGKRVLPQSKGYRSADKVLQISKPVLVIRGAAADSKDFPRGIIVRPEDIEEISLLTQVGNEVEIR
jgi:hypothetical protein